MSKTGPLQEAFLKALENEKIPLSIFLVNGIKLHGMIESYDEGTVLLKNSVTQMVFKHAISTIVPSKTVTFSEEK